MVMKPVADCGLSWLLHSRLSLNRFFASVCSLLIIPHHISSFGHFHAVRIRDFLRDLGMDLEKMPEFRFKMLDSCPVRNW